jgi:hypothetical protein
MGELDDAIRDHLELKRRRGADPAEVAREEQEALAPVTRSHQIVAVSPAESEPESELHLVHDDGGEHGNGAATPREEDLGDATQEFHVEFHNAHDDWLDDAGEA